MPGRHSSPRSPALGVFAAAAQAVPASFWGVVPQATQRGTVPAPASAAASKACGSRSAGARCSRSRAAPSTGRLRQPGRSGRQGRHRGAAVPHRRARLGGAGGRSPAPAAPKAPAHLPAAGAAAHRLVDLPPAAVARYGPNGSFWTENPGVPKRPIRTWQIWNEPNFKYFVAKPNPAEYGKLVKLSYTALKAADPGAKMILAGLFARPQRRPQRQPANTKASTGTPPTSSNRCTRRRPGIKTRFNGVALHPYTVTLPRTAAGDRRSPQRPDRERRRRQGPLDHRARLELGNRRAAGQHLRQRPRRPGARTRRRLHPAAQQAGEMEAEAASSGSRSTTRPAPATSATAPASSPRLHAEEVLVRIT